MPWKSQGTKQKVESVEHVFSGRLISLLICGKPKTTESLIDWAETKEKIENVEHVFLSSLGTNYSYHLQGL
ncbi:hypothetical protein J6590_001310 [Homalodisca vitripennis]|nr:hypothetical protein J6590_001310 [Homalodisca vitripennis]